ncbi:choice-of-anchor J domain-containing protein [Chryseobacterium fluminis]|uniref:T9SS-dependent choice-of-anchor J family protein n=1 Tax=Chryseobacterium fluminis TaxID=2983606 RepID=UPI00224FC8CE|nr:choice-of-anchor J domain-containing protein [Chryseobacterium sp. MMS21-Ot14]UZT96180.1 choice-of-anchor J domain-containing protein [Chryseobacterium sp. MMS21-Ot14]
MLKLLFTSVLFAHGLANITLPDAKPGKAVAPGESVTTSVFPPCSAVNVPYTENFETVHVPSLPVCTTVQNTGEAVHLGNMGSNVNDWRTSIVNANGFSGKVLSYRASFPSQPAKSWYYTRGINLSANTTYRIKFKYGNSSLNRTEKLKVAYGTSAAAAAMTNVITDFPSVTGGNINYFKGTFTPSVSGVYYFGFNAYSQAGQENLYVDDIDIDINSTCAEPGTPAVAPSPVPGVTSVSWLPSASGKYEIYYSTAPAEPSAQTLPVINNITTPGLSLNLTPGTQYYLWVRSVCGADSRSDWSNPVKFITGCAIAEVPYKEDFENARSPLLPICGTVQNVGTGNEWQTARLNANGFSSNVLAYKYHPSSAANVWYYTQGINLSADVTYRISFKYGNNDKNFKEKLKVACGTSASASAMNTIITDMTSISGGNAQTFTTTIKPSSSGVYFFGFNAVSDAGQYNLYIDDIAISKDVEVPATNPDITANSLVYPNPVKNVINIKDPKGILSISVIGLGGNVIKVFYGPKQSVDLSSLPNGTYVLALQYQNTRKNIRIVKE